jgi:hypothetical protein
MALILSVEGLITPHNGNGGITLGIYFFPGSVLLGIVALAIEQLLFKLLPPTKKAIAWIAEAVLVLVIVVWVFFPVIASTVH